MAATLDGKPVPFWEPLHVKAGSVLKLGAIQGAGQRSYLAVQGGFDLPEYMGSRATFTLGQFGGHGGRALRVGDVLRLLQSGCDPSRAQRASSAAERPALQPRWSIARLARAARRAGFLHRPRTSRRSSPPTGKCTTTPAAPACA